MFRTRVGTAIRITEFNPAKSRAIIAAVLEVWPFEGLAENGSLLFGLSDTRVEMTAIVTRNDVITEAAWRTNEAYCVVQVFDVPLDDDDRHYQDHYDRLAYRRWQEGERVFFHPAVPPVKGES
jgi:hypothetical protein